MKQLLWLWVQTLKQKGRPLLIILTSMLLFWMMVMLSMTRVLVVQGPAEEHLTHASPAFPSVALTTPGADVDPPIFIGQPHVFDARPCMRGQPDEYLWHRSLSGYSAAHVRTQAR